MTLPQASSMHQTMAATVTNRDYSTDPAPLDVPVAAPRPRQNKKLSFVLLWLLSVLCSLLPFHDLPPFRNTAHDLQEWTTSAAVQTTRDGLNRPYNNVTTTTTKFATTPAITATTATKSLCTRSEMRNGQWAPVRLRRPPFIPGDSSQCFLNENGTNLLRNYPGYWDTYEWELDNNNNDCLFSTFSREAFCDLVANKTILFNGDSVMREQYMSLVHSFGWRGNKRAVFEYGEYWICAKKSTRVLYKKDRKLARLPNFLNYNQPQIVILNRGVNFEPNDDTFIKDITGALATLQNWYNGPACSSDALEKNATSSYRDNSNKCVATWKTSIPGHPNCTAYQEPVNNITAMEELVADASLHKSPEDYEKWGWYAQKRQNKLVLQTFANVSKGLQFLEVMDAYDIQMLRPDSHRTDQNIDCLHNCIPGKTEVLNQILLHILRARFQRDKSYDDDRLKTSSLG